MKCKCSLNNNYEIIGLCDIEKYNEKIREFNDKSWTQITIPENLTIPSDAKDVKKIVETYVDIKITYTKIINTPISNKKSAEGFKITGKMLLISGELCQKIIYVTDNNLQSIHSVKFNTTFNTYIVSDKNVDIANDKYCVYPCIEDVSVKILNKRHLNKNINLVLFAHKIELPLNINNEFIFYDFSSIDKKEIVRVSFDNNKRKLKATSTGNPYNPPNENLLISFELTDSNGTRKAFGKVPFNQNGTDFVNSLNKMPFEVGNLIFLDYQDFKNTVLSNFPVIGEDYDMNFVGNRNFKITKDGIIPLMLPNVISLTSINNESVLNIGFDTFLKILLPHVPTFEVTNPRFRGIEYFKVTVKDSSLNEKYNASLQGDQNGLGMLRDLINKRFEYGDILELDYRERERISITDNPYPSSTKYNLKGVKSSFRITETGLEIINNSQILQNAIILSNSQNEEMLKIEFDINNLYLVATSTDVINNDFPGAVLLTFQINNINREIQFGQNAKSLARELDGEPFRLNQDFLISYKPEANINIKVTNSPRQGQNYTPRRTPPFESFRITQTGLLKL